MSMVYRRLDPQPQGVKTATEAATITMQSELQLTALPTIHPQLRLPLPLLRIIPKLRERNLPP